MRESWETQSSLKQGWSTNLTFNIRMEYGPGSGLLCALCFEAHSHPLLFGAIQGGTLPEQAAGRGGENSSLIALGPDKASTNKNWSRYSDMILVVTAVSVSPELVT